MTDQNSPTNAHVDLFPLDADNTPYRKLTDKHVSTVDVNGQTFLKVEPEAIRLLAEEAFCRYQSPASPRSLETAGIYS